MSEKIWEERYQAGQTGWDRGAISPALQKWLDDAALAPCEIIVPGCGRGHEVVELARRGFAVTALDIAPSPLASLRKALQDAGLEAKLLQEDVLHWQPPQPVDAVYEQTCLCALEPSTWPAYEQQLHRWLKPDGSLFALFMQTGKEGGPPYHCDMAQMDALFSRQRWRWLTQHLEEVPHPSGIAELANILQKQA